MMKRREFIKHALLASGAFLPGCGSGGNKNRKRIKVVLIGIDGANWPTIDPLIEQGKLPFWQQLKEESAWGNLKTFRPTKSSVVWTSIATGKRMEKHGILDFTFLDKNNMQVPFSNAERREPAIWQILDSFDRKCVIVNWFVSHPPDKIDGITISDNFRRVVARPPEKENDYIDSVHPTIYFHKLIKHANRNYSQVFKETGLPDFPKIYSDMDPANDFRTVPILKSYRSLSIQDYFVSNISKELYRTKDFDLFATYIRMPDLVQHFSARLFKKEYLEELISALKSNSLNDEQRKTAILKIAAILEPAYRFAEDLLKDLLTFKKYKDAYFIIASDHGFSLYPGGYNHYDLPEGYDPPPGILVMKGPGVQTGPIENATVYDIAPTILSLFNLPVGKNMDGKVLSKAFKFNRRLKYTEYKLDKNKQMKKHHPSKADKDTLEELKSIGYIQ
jgi:predicted AlkP superfamily phosphohydrolase/phosphomutase